MKKMAALMLVFLLGCAGAMNKTMASWEGHGTGEMVSKWGPPTSTWSDGSGGTVMAWVYSYTGMYTPATSYTESSGRVDRSGYGLALNGTSRTVYYPAMSTTWTSYRIVWADRSGIIYRWAWKGL